MKTLKMFINKHHIKITSAMVDRNPHMDDPDWRADHYKVTLRGTFDGHRRQLTTYFSMGIGLSREPRADDVLDCLASDSAGIENARDFEDWALEYGYDTDSRKAEKTYHVCQRQAARLARFVGDHYQALLYETEKL